MLFIYWLVGSQSQRREQILLEVFSYLLALNSHSHAQDLKDFARQSQLDVVYSETGRDRNGTGYVARKESLEASH